MYKNNFASPLIYVMSVAVLGNFFCDIFACDSVPQHELSTVNFHAASVMPVVWRHEPHQSPELYVLLSREAGGRDKGTYDDWGGSRDKGDQHPIVTATREFEEEAITGKTLGMGYGAIKSYIGVDGNRTLFVIVQEGVGGRSTMITYITLFDSEKINMLMSRFYKVRKGVKGRKYREKDLLALIPWAHLAKTLYASRYATNITLAADVIDPVTGAIKKEMVALRPAFVAKLRSLFKGKPHVYGENERILFFKSPTRDKKVDKVEGLSQNSVRCGKE